MAGTSRRVPALAKLSKGHSPDIKSLVSTDLCASCIWEVFVPAHFEILLAVELKEPQLVCLTSSQGEVWLSLERFAICSCVHGAAHLGFGRERTLRVILRNLLSLLVCLVLPSVRVMTIKSIFL